MVPNFFPSYFVVPVPYRISGSVPFRYGTGTVPVFGTKCSSLDIADSLEASDTERYSSIPCDSPIPGEDKSPNNPLIQNKLIASLLGPLPIASLLGLLPTVNVPSLDTIGPNIPPMSYNPNLKSSTN